ncbi:two-component sensor histidine kinase [Bacillus toyonensis]|uniref:sensor histidine kinase n=1 Tax=Bacillus toyonensis TaxID=155322 RepID=UPI000BF13427|nr:histidine kinase dimerization/phospho-acceptor domain-containing protein [Bacillus toyonensis]MDF9448728.1 histidine kinase dimerization/phospho-acceptor domain-containing protein [Bacillus toyonensis]PEO65276.1 two-component sensor histidine kinase [Bacillus toyonensis]PFX82711.1 two-component sensor histidine kinase [Bacillus toyonensis]PGB12313.1 two-component sensor histidine kinase [Bacillus toyonensis]PHF51464.1 two-component sensor histidine kinase [Bacillus toyonensis]
MNLKKKYQLLLFSAIISVPLLLLSISIFVSVIYNVVFKTKNQNIPFHESYAYPTMLIIFLLSLLILAFVFSKSINTVLNKINVLNQTIRDLASDKKIPNIINVKSDDEMGELIKSVNLLIERTTYRELELQQQEQIKKELLNKLRHDINTPLTAVRLQLYYLEGEYKEQAPVLESMYEQIQYISDLTNEFNIQSETLENTYIVNDEVNIHTLIENMIKKWSYLYSIHKIELVYNPQDKELIWNSNELWIQRLFDNIFQNVLKHSQAKTLEILIDNDIVSVRDNGGGFDINSKGTGLGLKNIEDISKMFDIKYTLQSNSEGTMFSFENTKV